MFAGIFLLPYKQFKADFDSLQRKTNPDSYIELKQKYLTSIVAMELRAFNADWLTYQQNRYFFSQINRKKYKAFEPLDDKIAPIRPGKIKSLVSLILDNHVLEINSILRRFSILPGFLTDLFALDSNFFDRYLSKKKDYFTVDNIINLPRN